MNKENIPENSIDVIESLGTRSYTNGLVLDNQISSEIDSVSVYDEYSEEHMIIRGQNSHSVPEN